MVIKIFYVLIFITVTIFTKAEAKAAKEFNVVFINPGHPDDNPTGNFWLNVSHFMEAAAKDLNIELKTIYAYRNHILMKSLSNELINNPPEYVIIVNEKDAALALIKQVTAHDIPVFILLNDISDAEKSSLNTKQRHLIIGSLIPNNYQVGKNLLDDIVKKHRDDDFLDGHVNLSLIALQGDYNTPASVERERGLVDGLKIHQQITFIDSSVANWSKHEAYQKVKGLIQRQRIDLIWAANDAMAFGAKKAVEEAELDYKVTIGGINWDVNDPQYPIDVSYGGHVTLGAMSLALIKDIHHKLLPKKQRHQQIDIFVSNDQVYLPTYLEKLINQQLAHYNFNRFSLTNDHYLTFSIENLMKTLEQQKNN